MDRNRCEMFVIGFLAQVSEIMEDDSILDSYEYLSEVDKNKLMDMVQEIYNLGKEEK